MHGDDSAPCDYATSVSHNRTAPDVPPGKLGVFVCSDPTHSLAALCTTKQAAKHAGRRADIPW